MRWIFLLSIGLLSVCPAFSQDQVIDSVVTVDTLGTNAPVVYPQKEKEADSTTEQEKPAPYIVRQLPDTMVQRWMKDPAMDYANDPDYWRRKAEEEEQHKPGRFWLGVARLLASAGFRYFMYTLLGGLLIYAIIRIMMENNVQLFY
ncbi:MAG: hypothetical protein JST68_16500, partial [Bacteroidetes bacterium]|nr:hypothetical protein [Bacteroidota bacterium]